MGALSVGQHVKSSIIPKGMTIVETARRLGVGRQALHTFLAGRARLSGDMASKLEAVFGADAAELLQMQREIDTAAEARLAVTKQAAGYLKIGCGDIENWAVSHRISSRSSLPVLVRRLISATALGISELDFHGDEEAERPGWDGEVVATSPTAKVPQGRSGWELSSSNDLPRKPEADIKGREKAIGPKKRQTMAFIYVTPRRWAGKEKWAEQHCASGAWKEVRAYDSEDLAQWLEQSVATQIWFAEQIGRPSDGVRSLEHCWLEWSMATEPHLSERLFDGGVKASASTLENWLTEPQHRPLVVTADSIAEGLAYLSVALPRELAEDAVVVSSADALRRTTAATADSLLIIDQSDVERVAGPYLKTHRIIVVRPKTSIENDADITLSQVDSESFRLALDDMGYGHEDVSSLSAQSAQSPTILRRRLATSPALRLPNWAQSGTASSRKLIPILLAGAWNRTNKTDCDVVAALANKPYDEIEKDLTELLAIPDSPVWALGNYRGIVCRRDALFAAHPGLLDKDIDEFVQWAEFVLSEDDPALDLEPDKRWSAAIYGKKREMSGALRQAVGDMLILLAVYGDGLVKGRLNRIKLRIDRLVKSLMEAKPTRALVALSSDLQALAEASPSVFLDCVETDLRLPQPQILPMLRPIEAGSFDSPDRTGLLWALELLAWDQAYYLSIVRILARLSQIPINDNWVNKPENTLESLVSCWHPETAVDVNGRIAALQLIAEEFPDVGWRICAAQVDRGHAIATPNQRPTYRVIGLSGSQKVTYADLYRVVDAAWDILLAWKRLEPPKIADLLRLSPGMKAAHKRNLARRIEEWIDSAPVSEKVTIAEELRKLGYSPERPKSKNKSAFDTAMAKVAKLLQPDDPVSRHKWLFAEHYVQESVAELRDEGFDFDKRDKLITEKRDEAALEIFRSDGVGGVLRLLESGNANFPLGRHLGNVITDGEVTETIGALLLSEEPDLQSKIDACIAGLLLKNGEDGVMALAGAVLGVPEIAGNEELSLRFFRACPFNEASWDLLEAYHVALVDRYWREVIPNGWWLEGTALERMVDRLLRARRPRAAFCALGHNLDKLKPTVLGRLLEQMVSGGEEESGTYPLDPYRLSQALSLIHLGRALSIDALARLEFIFVDGLSHSKHGIPNLERKIAENPASFVELVVLLYRRKDKGADPEQYQLSEGADRKTILHNVYRVLDKAARIPGTSDDGEIDVANLISWVARTREMLVDLSRKEIGDQQIGQLLGRGPVGRDGIWPHQAIRMALETIGSEEIARGMELAVYNSRGVVARGPGGDQERALAAKYQGWSDSLAQAFPFTSRVLRGIAEHYLHDAEWHDTDENVRKRLGRH